MDAPFRQYVGWERFPENLTEPEVAHFFSLSGDDRRAVHRRRRPLNRLGVALQVGFLRLTGAPLNSVEMIPPQVLAHLGAELGIAPPRLASIRALYRRHRTLFEHQGAAKQALGLRDLTEHGERALNGFLRREAGDKFLVDELEQAARAWLRDHHYVQLPTRRLRSSASGARRHYDGVLLAGAVAAVGIEQTKVWPLELSETMPNGKTRLEWLRDSPASRKTKGLADHIAKIDFLKKLGANKLDLGSSTGYEAEAEENGEDLEPLPAGDVEHQFLVRPGRRLHLRLPYDLTERERERLAQFVQSLPFHDGYSA